jgi:hypothetical protein
VSTPLNVSSSGAPYRGRRRVVDGATAPDVSVAALPGGRVSRFVTSPNLLLLRRHGHVPTYPFRISNARDEQNPASEHRDACTDQHRGACSDETSSGATDKNPQWAQPQRDKPIHRRRAPQQRRGDKLLHQGAPKNVAIHEQSIGHQREESGEPDVGRQSKSKTGRARHSPGNPH